MSMFNPDTALEGLAIADDTITSQDGVVRSASAGSNLTLSHLEQMRTVDRRSDEIRTALNNVETVTSLSAIATEHNFSAPLVAAFMAIPGFTQMVANFPGSAAFNIVPAAATSADNVAGLEALQAGEVTAVDTLQNGATQLVAAFSQTLDNLGAIVTNLRQQVTDATHAVALSDITDDVLQTLPVTTLSNELITDVLTQVEARVSQIDVFDVEAIRSNPLQLADQIQGMESLVAESGGFLGLTLDSLGLKETDRDAAYVPTTATFGEKGIDKASLMFQLTQAGAVVDALQTVVDRKDEITNSLSAALADMPAITASTEVQYGKVEHIVLLNSHVSFVNKMVREAVVDTALVLSTVDSAINIDDGQR
jgi:hypothetical protein